MGAEKRKEIRVVARELSKGELYHPNSGQYLRVKDVRDVSIDGIGLTVDAFLEKGEKVRLGFKYGRGHIEMYGHVVWCAPVDGADSDEVSAKSFMMGVTL